MNTKRIAIWFLSLTLFGTLLKPAPTFAVCGPTTGGSDFEVVAVWPSPQPVIKGTTVTITATVKNCGPAPQGPPGATATLTLDLYDRFQSLVVKYIGSFPTPALKAGEQGTVTASLDTTFISADYYYIKGGVTTTANR